MNSAGTESSFLLKRFRAFYQELARLKAIALRSGEPLSGTKNPTGLSASAENIWQQLVAILESQALEASTSGGAFAFETYREAQYVMAALADEIFLHLDWTGKESWPLIEGRLFQTHIAGEALFQRLDRLLLQRDPFYLDLAAVYFIALSVGFQGKFRGSSNADQLERYRRQLFVMMKGRQPKLFTSADPMFSNAQQNTLDQLERRKLPDNRFWLGLVAAILIVWFGVSLVLWNNLSAGVDARMRRIQELSRTAAGTDNGQPGQQSGKQ